MDDLKECQEAFEAWARDTDQFVTLQGAAPKGMPWIYFDDEAGDAWEVWQAAWNRRAVPQASAEQDAVEPEQWSYSTNEEDYQGQEDSREAVIQVALSEIGEHSGAFWIGKNRQHVGSGAYITESVIEGLQEQAWEACGEFADTFLDDVTKEEEKELADLITDWCARVDRSTFWTVFDVELLHIEDLIAASNATRGSDHGSAASKTTPSSGEGA